ncbi:MAG: RES family NAD+ phosphorylase [Proteobacteria bacterium]|nr:RES family NAD+ phosphorylase [Pseudomonadota bacterium]
MTIWSECEGSKYCKSLDLELWRIVEAQHISSSRDLVDSTDEHELLENLLENSKPKLSSNKPYLIFTPFRYPPLKYGSRFGNIYEPSLWYGSINIETALAEVAYYRLKFFDDTLANLGYIEIPMTAFKAYIKTKSGIDLTKSPFKKYKDWISHKINYQYSQQLGSEMREAKVEAFIYMSARDNNGGKNAAVFTPGVFNLKEGQYVFNSENWRSIANNNVIEFTRNDILSNKQHIFYKDQFEVDF